MKTLLLQGGDLVLGQDGFATISGMAKTQQDLGIAVREPLGVDRFHPRWGSVLHELIGLPSFVETETRVKGEITRIVMNYAAVQAEALSRDASVGRKTRYETGEVIADITAVDVRQELDRYHVRVKIRTLSGQELSVIRSVS